MRLPPTFQVAVIGGGIMGASAAWHLAQTGATVTLIEHQADNPISATGASFGWIGASASTPSADPAAFALRRQALEAFPRLAQTLGALPITARGALHWRASEADTAAMMAEQHAAGTCILPLSRREIADKIPHLAAPPLLAAWAPDDFALEPAILAQSLRTHAQSAGARIHHGHASRLVTANGRVAGVIVDTRTIAADLVVLANGCGAPTLALTANTALPVEASPAVLLRFEADASRLSQILSTPALELRPDLAGGLTAAEDYPDSGDAALPALAASTGQAIARLFGDRQPPRLLAMHAVQRPMTPHRPPLAEFLPGVSGLYALVAHPGVILAPMLGQQCAAAICRAYGSAT